MAFIEITHQAAQNPNPKFKDKLSTLKALLQELEQRDLPDTAITYINTQLEEINAKATTDPKLYKTVWAKQNCILKYLEKHLKLVPQGYYQKLWTVLGMSTFGLPLGVVFGTTMGNMAFLGIGLPIGMAIGMVVGSNMDKKAAKEGRQLDFKGNVM